ncbi:SAVED domain-containing protein, partial [Escherichia coli]|nr:SAVED domain-containing protein [Escherichia coli]
GYEKNIADAISNVNDTISKLITADNISERFKLIINDVSKEWPLFEKLKKLGDNSLSLDKRVDKIIVPVFICYEASIVKDYKDEE